MADWLISINVCTQIIIFNVFPCDTQAVISHIQFFLCCRFGMNKFVVVVVVVVAVATVVVVFCLSVCLSVRTLYTPSEWCPHISIAL